jgi:hypothetical protein
MVQQGAGTSASAHDITSMPPREYRFSFGLLYPVSKLLTFFKLFGQRLNTESKRTIVNHLNCQIDVYLNTPNARDYFKNGRCDAARVAKLEIIVGSKRSFRLTEQH